MDKKDAEKYIKAGKILKEVKENARKNIKSGQKLLDIAENIEKAIANRGAKPAFPVNLSINNNAAHYTPSAEDETVLHEKDVLKVDLGCHIDGFVADCAFTVNPSNEFKEMIEASEKALENALKVAKQGALLSEIGSVIEKTIKDYGFNPVQNLSGHGLKKYSAHSEPSIPNVSSKDSRKLIDGSAIAIEPFATNGKGYVKEAPQSEIFQIDEPKPVRNTYARKVLEFALENYKTLPFAERWLEKELKLSEFQRKVALRELLQKKCIKAFPILREEPGKIVSQAETSLLLFEGKVIKLV